MVKTTELERAYRATTYRVFLPGGVCDLRIGQVSDTLRCWLEAGGYQHFAILTAFNPGSLPEEASVNLAHQSQLECELLEANYEPFAGQNLPDNADAPIEESCLVPDLAPEDACALAADYGQNALVCGGIDGLPHLLWIEHTET